MFKIQYSIGILLFFMIASCKKNGPLPDAGIGNDFNPASGKDVVIIDSFKNNYSGSSKAIQIWFRTDKTLLTSVNISSQRIKVYKDGIFYAQTLPNQTYIWDHYNIVSGYTYNYEFAVLTDDNQESKRTKCSVLAN